MACFFLFFLFFPPNLCCGWVGNHAQEDFAKFG
jgi:hypothetical protein